MKVINLLTAGHIGGIETLCMDHAARSGHDIVMVILWGDGHVDELMRARGIRVINLHASRRNVIGTVNKVMDIIREEHADVVIAQHEASMSHLCLMRAKSLFPGIRTIAYAHLNASDMVRAKEKKRLWLRKAVLGTSLKRADNVIAISDSVKISLTEVLDTPGDKISIVYNGVDLEAFPYVERDMDKPVCELVYTGRLIEEKGVDLIIKALSCVKDRSRYHLRIIGDGPVRKELEDLTQTLGLEHEIEFTGSRDDVPELIKGSEEFVHMPVWEEGFGISLVEAMSSGCVCICASSGAVPEIITDGTDGYLVDKGDHAGLAGKLDEVYELDAEEKLRMARAAHEKAEKFSIERFVKELDAVISGPMTGHK